MFYFYAIGNIVHKAMWN